MNRFENRREAGRLLADKLLEYKSMKDLMVLGLPRGGVPVAFEIGQKLEVSLDVLIVRKLGLPYNPEVAFGAIASGGIKIINHDMVRRANLTEEAIERVFEKEQKELAKRQEKYGSSLLEDDLKEKTIILVDDGMATGATMQVAIKGLKGAGVKSLIVAVGTAPPDTLREIESMVDEAISLLGPKPFFGVGTWYKDFSQTTDQEVRDLLERTKDDN
ncbi:MAG: phosphoribosyltransferase [Candidatus Lokiarchaeota archaeon]|nr:phosphoribosyltransferase [Candidatus Lokiarchaeota archaeon]